MTDLSRLCIHTITTKPWPLQDALEHFSAANVGGISIWQNASEMLGTKKSAELLKEYPVQPVSYVRGGFFPDIEKSKREAAIAHNKQLIDEAAMLGAPLLVLVCGADPRQSLTVSREQISDGIESLLPYAQTNDVKLAIEPLHPMYADTRSAINTLAQANDLAERLDDPYVGVAVDVYHLWWDPDLQAQISRCGKEGNLLAFHICDWKSPTTDMLNDRGLMGEGCIPIRQISDWVADAGFRGFIEVEIFSNQYWSMDQELFLQKIISAYQRLYK